VEHNTSRTRESTRFFPIGERGRLGHLLPTFRVTESTFAVPSRGCGFAAFGKSKREDRVIESLPCRSLGQQELSNPFAPIPFLELTTFSLL